MGQCEACCVDSIVMLVGPQCPQSSSPAPILSVKAQLTSNLSNFFLHLAVLLFNSLKPKCSYHLFGVLKKSLFIAKAKYYMYDCQNLHNMSEYKVDMDYYSESGLLITMVLF